LPSLLNKNWLIAKPDEDVVALLVRELKVLPVVACLLANRKVTDVDEARQLVDPDLSLLHDPFLMLGMRVAVDRIVLAIESKEKITLFCDYDVDGVTSAAFMTHFFRDLDVAVDYYLPDRHSEGYGLNENAVRKIREGGSSLMITADCGITNVREVELAGETTWPRRDRQRSSSSGRSRRSQGGVGAQPASTRMHVSFPFFKRRRHCFQTGDSGAQRIAS
jgi:single-stranded-DNA-specific exonuclease